MENKPLKPALNKGCCGEQYWWGKLTARKQSLTVLHAWHHHLPCSSDRLLSEGCLSFQDWLHRDVPFHRADYLCTEDVFLSQVAGQLMFPLPGAGECCLTKKIFLELFEVYPLEPSAFFTHTPPSWLLACELTSARCTGTETHAALEQREDF